jgi:hypothetical protein
MSACAGPSASWLHRLIRPVDQARTIAKFIDRPCADAHRDRGRLLPAAIGGAAGRSHPLLAHGFRCGRGKVIELRVNSVNEGSDVRQNIFRRDQGQLARVLADPPERFFVLARGQPSAQIG